MMISTTSQFFPSEQSFPCISMLNNRVDEILLPLSKRRRNIVVVAEEMKTFSCECGYTEDSVELLIEHAKEDHGDGYLKCDVVGCLNPIYLVEHHRCKFAEKVEAPKKKGALEQAVPWIGEASLNR